MKSEIKPKRNRKTLREREEKEKEKKKAKRGKPICQISKDGALRRLWYKTVFTEVKAF